MKMLHIFNHTQPIATSLMHPWI